MIPRIVDIPGIKEIRAGSSILWQRAKHIEVLLDSQDLEIYVWETFIETSRDSVYEVEFQGMDILVWDAIIETSRNSTVEIDLQEIDILIGEVLIETSKNVAAGTAIEILTISLFDVSVVAIASDWTTAVVNKYETRVLADYGIVEDKTALITYLQS